ncbi:MAG: hypothetical protein K9H16_10485, partial [Bacteroidales bacterium]|nr:hypothetical protein [Bacteroidales bacterium]
MKSNFEKYLRAQHPKMDIDEPDDEVIWKKIEGRLNISKPGWRVVSWKAAAIFIFLISSTYIYYNEFYRNKTSGIYNITLSEIEPAYAVQVESYAAEIDARWKLINHSKSGDLKKFKLFFNELNDLDTMYREYQEDFRAYGYNERLVRAMLDYYDKRIRILDRILMEIEKQKDYEKR